MSYPDAPPAGFEWFFCDEISAGNNHTLAIKDGQLYVWGENTHGQCGLGPPGAASPSWVRWATPVPGMTNCAKVEAGNQCSFVIKNDGTLWACGSNEFRQQGDGSTSERYTFSQVPGISDVARVSAYSHVLALKTDGSVWVWGRNDNGMTGHPPDSAYPYYDENYQQISTPTEIPNWPSAVIQVEAAPVFSLFVTEDLVLWAAGGPPSTFGFSNELASYFSPPQIISLEAGTTRSVAGCRSMIPYILQNAAGVADGALWEMSEWYGQ